MTNNRAQPAERDDRQNNHRLQIAAKLQGQQHVHANQRDGKAFKHAVHRFNILSRFALPIDGDLGIVFIFVFGNQTRQKFALHLLNNFSRIGFLAIHRRRNRNRTSLIQSIDFRRCRRQHGRRYIQQRALNALVVTNPNIFEFFHVLSSGLGIANHQFDFVTPSLLTPDLFAKITTADSTGQHRFVQPQRPPGFVQPHQHLSFAFAGIVFDIRHANLAGQKFFAILCSPIDILDTTFIKQQLELDSASAGSHRFRGELQRIRARDFRHLFTP